MPVSELTLRNARSRYVGKLARIMYCIQGHPPNEDVVEITGIVAGVDHNPTHPGLNVRLSTSAFAWPIKPARRPGYWYIKIHPQQE